MNFDEILERCSGAGDRIRSARSDWRTLSDEARSEVAAHRAAWVGSADARHIGRSAVRAYNLDTGDVITGDDTVERTVTEALEALVRQAEAVDGDTVYGVGSRFDVVYEFGDRYGPYLEMFSRDSFNESLRLPDLQCSFCRGHAGEGMATTRAGRMFLDADDHGLLYAASVDIRESDANDLVLKLRNGSTPGDASVGAGPRGLAGEWTDDWTGFVVLRWSLSRGEISVVRTGANPGAWSDVYRGADDDMDEKGDMDTEKSVSDALRSDAAEFNYHLLTA